MLFLCLRTQCACRNFIATTCPRFIEDLPLLNTKWMLPNSTIVLNLWFIIRSNSFTVWDISFILLKLLHSIMGPFPLNSVISSLILHEYQWYREDVITAFISLFRHAVPGSPIFFHSTTGIRSDHMSYSTSSYSQLLFDLLHGYRRYISFRLSCFQ